MYNFVVQIVAIIFCKVAEIKLVYASGFEPFKMAVYIRKASVG